MQLSVATIRGKLTDCLIALAKGSHYGDYNHDRGETHTLSDYVIRLALANGSCQEGHHMKETHRLLVQGSRLLATRESVGGSSTMGDE